MCWYISIVNKNFSLSPSRLATYIETLLKLKGVSMDSLRLARQSLLNLVSLEIDFRQTEGV
jgi:hypothetical protein